MDNNYLEELIEEVKARGGGMVLHANERPEVVVLTVDKYNDLLSTAADKTAQSVLEQVLGVPQGEPSKQTVLVTGGAGYIGAHVAREFIKSGFRVVVLDNLSSGKRENVPAEARFIEGDLKDAGLLRDIFASEEISAVVHMAASIEVEESVREPEKYLQNNTLYTVQLLTVMNEYNVKNIVFSSTAAVYGEQTEIPIKEGARLRPNNPYGYSKLLAEKMIKYYSNFLGFRAVIFRYFNACGCDFDGAIRSTHESHLLPIVMEVAAGKRQALSVNGTDYPTHDGTAVRDYVHVLDIARAHVLAVEKISEGDAIRVFNIGTGKGSSVLDMVNKTAEITGHMIPMEPAPRRAGDAVATVADNTRIKQELGFELKYSDLDTIIQTTWNQLQKA